MNDPTSSRSDSNWAKPVDTLSVGSLPPGALNLNVQGKRLSGPVRGFGQLWQKTYRIQFSTSPAPVSPQHVVQEWKTHFPTFWPKGNRFYRSGSSITPGDVAVLNLAGPGGVTAPGGGPLISTGIMVIYADDESFSFMTPEGHLFAGMITFSAEDCGDGQTAAQIQALVRANDPLYEVMFRLGASKMEDQFWLATLRNVAAHLGLQGEPTCRSVCVDSRLAWHEAGNIRHNAGIRTALYTLGAPLRWVKRQLK